MKHKTSKDTTGAQNLRLSKQDSLSPETLPKRYSTFKIMELQLQSQRPEDIIWMSTSLILKNCVKSLLQHI